MITNELASLREIRAELIRMRDRALEAARWEETVVLSHAIAWLHKLLPMEQRDAAGIPEGNQIFAYLHCVKCFEEITAMVKEQGSARPQMFTRYEIGWTQLGFQARCVRHNLNIVHVDFEGIVHPARVTGT